MATVTQKFDGDSRDLEQAYDKIVRQNIKLESQVKKLAATTARVSKRHEGDLQRRMRMEQRLQQTIEKQRLSQARFAQGAVALGAAYGIVRSGIALANQELQHQAMLQDRAVQVQKTIGQSQAGVVQNLTGVSLSRVEGILTEAKEIQRETGFADLRQLNAAVAGAVSASGGDNRAAMESVRSAAPLSLHTPDQIQLFAEGALDMIRAGAAESAKEGLGTLMSIGSLARITSLDKQVITAAPAVQATIRSMDTDAETSTRQGGALFAFLTAFGNDREGLRSRTAQITFTQQIKEAFEKGIKIDGKVVVPDSDPGDLFGRIKYLQQNEQMGQAFLDTTTREKQFKDAISILVQGSEGADKLQEFAAQILSGNKAVAEYQAQVVKLTRASAELAVSLRQAKQAAVFQKFDADNTALGRTGEIRKITESINERIDFGWVASINNFTQSVELALSEDKVATAIKQLEEKLLNLPNVVGMSNQERQDAEGLIKNNIQSLRDMRTQTAVMSAERGGNRDDATIRRKFNDQTKMTKIWTEKLGVDFKPSVDLETAAGKKGFAATAFTGLMNQRDVLFGGMQANPNTLRYKTAIQPLEGTARQLVQQRIKELDKDIQAIGEGGHLSKSDAIRYHQLAGRAAIWHDVQDQMNLRTDAGYANAQAIVREKLLPVNSDEQKALLKENNDLLKEQNQHLKTIAANQQRVPQKRQVGNPQQQQGRHAPR